MAVDGVVAVARVDGVIGGVAGQRVVARRGGEHLGLDGGNIPHRAIGELEVLHHVTRCTVGVEVALHRQAVVAAVDADDQIVGLAGQCHAGSSNACAQQDGVSIGAHCFAVVVIDGVLARAFAEDVGVSARATAQVVVAATAVQAVVAVAAVQVIVAGTSVYAVVTCVARQVVVARPAYQRVVTFAPVKHIITSFSVEYIIAVTGTEVVGNFAA